MYAKNMSKSDVKSQKIFDINLIFFNGSQVRAVPEDFNSKIFEETNKHNIVILKDFLSAEEVINLKNQTAELKEKYNSERIAYSKNCRDFHHLEFNSKEDDERRVREGRQKRPRRFYLYKFLPWNFRNKLFEKSVNDIIKLRNTFYENQNLYNNYINIPQILHYRQGGDFLAEHKDIVFHSKQGLSSHIEIITLLSDIGKSFVKGGLFIRTKKNKVIYVENYCKSGDLVLYNVSNPHGCSPIDEGHISNAKVNLEGRYSMLVPPYKKNMYLKN